MRRYTSLSPRASTPPVMTQGEEIGGTGVWRYPEGMAIDIGCGSAPKRSHRHSSSVET